MQSRPLTEAEISKMFLDTIDTYVHYWGMVPGTASKKLHGLAHSILVMLDGEDAYLPAFKVLPSPHPDDRAYHEERGENWWPGDIDIAGGLHDEWGKYGA